MSDELKRQYADKLHWLEMGIPYSESETNPHEMVFSLAMQWKDVVPLAERIRKLERMLVDVHDMLDHALFAGYHTNEGALRINWCHQETKKLKEQMDEDG